MVADAPIIIEPASPARATVIILHGLGANGHDFESIVPLLELPEELAVRFVLPHAPTLPVTINGGMTMPAWYDILDMDLGRRIDEPQLRDSAQRVQGLIDEQIDAGIDSHRIIVAGFSQGGAVAYEAALSYPRPLGGVLALSTYLATADSLQPSEANRNISIEVHHGTQDPVVPETLGRQGAEQLAAMGYPVRYRTWPMPHSVSPEQLPEIRQWLLERLQPSEK